MNLRQIWYMAVTNKKTNEKMGFVRSHLGVLGWRYAQVAMVRAPKAHDQPNLLIFRIGLRYV